MRRIAHLAIGLMIIAPTFATAKTKEKDFYLQSGNVTGEIVRGPRVIAAHQLNVLRYNYRFNSAVTYSQQVDFWSKLTEIAAPSVPAVTTQTVTEAIVAAALSRSESVCEEQFPSVKNSKNAKVSRDICKAWDVHLSILRSGHDLENMARNIDSDRIKFQKYLGVANSSIRKVKLAGSALALFLSNTTGDQIQTERGINSQLDSKSTFMEGIQSGWPDVQQVAALSSASTGYEIRLEQYSESLTEKSAQNTASQEALEADQRVVDLQPADKESISEMLDYLKADREVLSRASEAISRAIAANASIVAGLPNLQEDGTKYAEFKVAHDQLIYWETRMRTLLSNSQAYTADRKKNSDPFTLKAEGTCEAAFSRNKTTAITLTRVDQMPGSTASEAVLSVIVECSSPFTVSAGIAFSGLKEREFGIQPIPTTDSTPQENRIVATTKSSFHPLPIGMVHVRLWEPSETYSIHGSFGVAANIRSQNSGGSDAEFLIGPSISFFRTMFLTTGLHVGRDVRLSPGYTENGPVSSSVTSATILLQKSYRPALGFAVTFTKP